MNATDTSPPIRVLVDLKPALDGYAGIPQESRLLFRGLSAIKILKVEGLIQHGGRRLRAALKPGAKPMSEARRIDRLSRFIVSIYEKPYHNIFEAARDKLEKNFARQWMQLQSHLGVALPMSCFKSDLFEDFVWRTFFSKTLNPADKPALHGASFRVLAPSRQMLHQAGLAGLKYSDTPRYPTLETGDFDYFLTQTPFPGRVQKNATMVVRYHDAVPILMPHTISNKAFHQASHLHALKDNVLNGAWFSCISHATRADLLKIFPEVETRSSVIHNIVSDEYFPEASPSGMVLQIVRNRLASSDEVKFRLPKYFQTENASNRLQYLLMVSTIEPRKNHLLLMQAWERLKYTHFPDLKIMFVGNTGWDQGEVLKAFQPWAERGDLFWLNNVPSSELRVLYQHAAITVCPGLAEGFDYSGVEAMKCGGIVASSDIPVHREIYQDASVFFDPYDAEDTAVVLENLLNAESSQQRDNLRLAGERVSALYSAKAIMPQWEAFFQRIHADRSAQAL